MLLKDIRDSAERIKLMGETLGGMGNPYTGTDFLPQFDEVYTGDFAIKCIDELIPLVKKFLYTSVTYVENGFGRSDFQKLQKDLENFLTKLENGV